MLLNVFITLFLSCQQAFIIDPVVDCTADPDDLYTPMLHVELTEKRYNPRCYQLLFNEIVTIVARQDEKVKVEIPNIYFYGSCRNVLQGNSFWICKKSICLLDGLKKEDGIKIPPITFDYLNYYNKIVTLVYPFYDPVTKKIYSAGTKFVLTGKPKRDCYSVFIFDSQSFCFKQTKIPKDLCLLYQAKTTQEKIDDFLFILKQWTNLDGGYIPYVWGGSSFCYVLQQDQNPPDWIAQCGFDCSCMITRAAQIAGLPYFFKNSTTLHQLCTPIQPHDFVHNGDIIWFAGHVMIVADIIKNLIIESRGYGAGFGRVHEIHISKIFQNIHTFSELINAYKKNESVWLLHADGTPRLQIKEFMIFNLKQLI